MHQDLYYRSFIRHICWKLIELKDNCLLHATILLQEVTMESIIKNKCLILWWQTNLWIHLTNNKYVLHLLPIFSANDIRLLCCHVNQIIVPENLGWQLFAYSLGLWIWLVGWVFFEFVRVLGMFKFVEHQSLVGGNYTYLIHHNCIVLIFGVNGIIDTKQMHLLIPNFLNRTKINTLNNIDSIVTQQSYHLQPWQVHNLSDFSCSSFWSVSQRLELTVAVHLTFITLIFVWEDVPLFVSKSYKVCVGINWIYSLIFDLKRLSQLVYTSFVWCVHLVSFIN